MADRLVMSTACSPQVTLATEQMRLQTSSCSVTMAYAARRTCLYYPANTEGGLSMKGPIHVWPIGLTLLALFATDGRLFGDLYNKTVTRTDAVALPAPAEIRSLTLSPKQIALKGADDAQQIICTAEL